MENRAKAKDSISLYNHMIQETSKQVKMPLQKKKV